MERFIIVDSFYLEGGRHRVWKERVSGPLLLCMLWLLYCYFSTPPIMQREAGGASVRPSPAKDAGALHSGIRSKVCVLTRNTQIMKQQQQEQGTQPLCSFLLQVPKSQVPIPRTRARVGDQLLYKGANYSDSLLRLVCPPSKSQATNSIIVLATEVKRRKQNKRK